MCSEQPQKQATRFQWFDQIQLSNLLQTLVSKNKFSNVYINNFIVSNSNGIGDLYYEDRSTETASTVQNFQDSFNSSIKIEKITLDQYVKDNGIEAVHLLKVDVEGGELEVFEGAVDTLSKFNM